MRANPTDAERRIWSVLRAKRLCELKWKRQVVFEDLYIADFVSFAHRLIVEADGNQHCENPMDVIRDAWFNWQGFEVLRFWNNDILTNTDGVATAILAAVESSGATDVAPSPLPSPLPQGERGIGLEH